MPRLKGETLKMASLIDGVSQDLGDLRTASIALRRASPDAGYLFGEPAPPPAPPPPPPPAAPPAPVAAAVPVAPPPSPPVAPVAVAPPEPLPAALTAYDEMQMTDADRRTTQTVLSRLGYYPGPIDGIFGPDTRAAIRRLQYELHAPMTGQLTGEQVRRLMAHR
jgi:type IV secretory pathway VirB10-like protein